MVSTQYVKPPDSEVTTRILCVALYDYTAHDQNNRQLSFRKGEQFEVLDKTGAWWLAKGVSTELEGYIPSNYMNVTPGLDT